MSASHDDQVDQEVEKQFQYHHDVFEQYNTSNKVACSVIIWLDGKEVPFSFEKVEPIISNVNPDIIASHRARNSGLVIEIKSERSNEYLPKEGAKLRGQLEAYLNIRENWPTHTQGASKNIDSVDVVFISHSDNAEVFLSEIEKSEVLRDALGSNLALLAWEMVAVRSGERVRIKYYKGNCRETKCLEVFKGLNGYERDIQDLTVFQVDNSVRMKISDLEPLLVLMTEKALSLPTDVLSIPKGLLTSEKSSFIQNEHVYFQLEALFRTINSINDAGKSKYMARISRSYFEKAFATLIMLDVFQRDSVTPYYMVSQAKKEKELPYWVLRQLARKTLSERSTEKAETNESQSHITDSSTDDSKDVDSS